ncbi:MAG TPA: hypothetical protein VF559_06415 [Caulobacteraceae bacterium]|jgi:hypothetical protein
MENIHHTHKSVSLDWLRDLHASFRATRRPESRTAPARKPAPRWGSRLVSGL